jgi:glyoxylase I family protein
VQQRPKVFISYSHGDQGDRAVVDAMIKQLRRADIAFWHDGQISAGEDWSVAIEDALTTATVFVVLITPSFLASKWGMLELGAAVERARQGAAIVIPVVAGPVHLPNVLRRFQPIEAGRLDSTELIDRIRASEGALRSIEFTHVSLPVRDIERSKRFYRDVLGLAEVSRPPFTFDGAWFELPSGQQLHLIENQAGTFRNTDEIDVRDTHFAVRVQDFRNAVERLKQHGFTPASDLNVVTGNHSHGYLLDPDGHVIEVRS